MNEINDQNGQHEDKNHGKGNTIKSLLLIGAVLIVAAVLVNSIVTARVPVEADAAKGSTALNFATSLSCCARDQTQISAASIGQEALVYYKVNFEEEADSAAVEDYGCHQEIVILKAGQPIHRLAYNGGVISDLGPITDETGS